MAIPFPQFIPDDIPLVQIEFQRFDGVAVAEGPFTEEQDFLTWGREFWGATVTWPRRTRAVAQRMNGIIASLRGPGGPILLGSRLMDEPLGSLEGPGPIVVDGALASRSTQVTLRGFTPLATGVVMGGDLLQLGAAEHSRLHQVLGGEPLDADAAGKVVVDLWPRVRASQVDGAAVVFSKPRGVFSLGTTTSGWVERDRVMVEVTAARFTEFVLRGTVV